MLSDRELADEVIQDVFWLVWRSAARLDSERAGASRWQLMMARSRAVDALGAVGAPSRASRGTS